jgi:hypothetical protein
VPVATPNPLRLAGFHAAARALYGELWQPTLLAVSGTLSLSPTHMDAWLPLSAVQLPVRAAGLDLNPRWLPWLGRVVTIRYATDPNPHSTYLTGPEVAP